MKPLNNRTNRIFAYWDAPADAALILSEVNRFYYTGFAASDGALLITRDGALFYTDSRYTEAAEKKLGKDFVRDSAKLYDRLAEVFAEENVKTVAVEADRVTLSQFEELREKLPDAGWDASAGLSKAINRQRMVKDETEIENIVAAQRIAEAAFDHILGFIKPGLTEKEIALELEYFMLKNGADGLSFETIAVSGANSSLPHGVPGDKPVEIGDFITMDYGALKNGYHSDMTRTVALGTATDEMRRVYDTVLQAQTASLAAIRDGVSGFDADKAARDVIKDAGYGDYFGHGTGHGVGVEIHELPRLSPLYTGELHTGHVVTAEPGIYLPGRFGVRIEDMALVTDDGCENLTRCPKELIVL